MPIPILDEEMALFTAVRDRDITAPVIDYSESYPNNAGEPLGHVTYEELRSGTIEVQGRRIRTAALSSYFKARCIAEELKEWIERGEFTLGRPVDPLPREGSRQLKRLEIRLDKNGSKPRRRQ